MLFIKSGAQRKIIEVFQWNISLSLSLYHFEHCILENMITRQNYIKVAYNVQF